jgi:choline-sulfatase
MSRARPRAPILPRARTWIALAVALASCRSSPPNLLFIVSDTLRADMLSCYGGPARTPNICSLAQRGALFERSYANAAWTLPSSVAIFTGQHPNGFARRGAAEKNDFYLVDDSEELLAEALVARGYRAVAFVENQVVLRPQVLQGFEVKPVWKSDWLRENHAAFAARTGFDVSDFRYNQIAAPIRFLRSEAREPFAVLVWIMDPHATYSPERRFASTVDFDFSLLPQPPDYYARLAAADVPKNEWLDFNRLAPSMSEAEIEFVRLLYRTEIESVDERVGWLLAELERGGRRGSTLVVFSSDHGEGFLEHGMVFHSDKRLFEEFVRVPLLVAGPGIERGRRHADPVSHLDLLPTLRELLGLPPCASDQGRSLAKLLRGEVDALPAAAHYISGNSRAKGYAALVAEGHKLLLDPEGARLYDLALDPGEQRDVAAQKPELAARLRAALDAATAEDERRLAARASRADAELLERTEAETLEQLRALGYVQDEAQGAPEGD